MIFILALFLAICLSFTKKKQKCFLKTKTKYFQKQIDVCFFSKKHFFYFKENYSVLKTYNLQVAIKVEEILCKLRFNVSQNTSDFSCPFYKIEKQDLKDLKNIFISKQFEDFCLYTPLKKIKNKNIKFVNDSNQLKKMEKNNFNKKIKKELIINNYQIFNFYESLECTEIYEDECFLQRLKNDNFEILIYKFFNVYYLEIKNISNYEQNLNFNYFFNLKKDKYNFYSFKTYNQSVKYTNLLSGKTRVLNFSLSYDNSKFSQIENMERSNYPCINLLYKLSFLPKENKKLMFCDSCHVIDLNSLSLEKLKNFSKQKLEQKFRFQFVFSNKLDQCFQKAKQEFLKGESSCVIIESFESLTRLFLQGEISNLQFYESVIDGLIFQNEKGFEIKRNFITRDFKLVVRFDGSIKEIDIKANCYNNFLILDGIRYTHTFFIDYQTLILTKNILLETI